jgi:hypothetical protein
MVLNQTKFNDFIGKRVRFALGNGTSRFFILGKICNSEYLK